MLRADTPYSYRAAEGVTGFPDEGPCAVMDARCALCAKGAAWIAKNDAARNFRIIPMQSPLGAALFRHYGLDPDDPTSWLLLHQGVAFASLDALMRTGRLLGGRWRALILLRFLPRPVRDAMYRLVARNRYRWFGRADLCTLPNPPVRERLIL